MIPGDALAEIQRNDDRRISCNGIRQTIDKLIKDVITRSAFNATSPTTVRRPKFGQSRFKSSIKRRRLSLIYSARRRLGVLNGVGGEGSRRRKQIGFPEVTKTRSTSHLRNSSGVVCDDALVPRCDTAAEGVVLTSSTDASASAAVNQRSHCFHTQTPRAPAAGVTGGGGSGGVDGVSPELHCSLLCSESRRETRIHRFINIPVPDDPRQWSRLDVRTWLEHMKHSYNIRDLDPERFPMNGKGLCIGLLRKEFFIDRVPNGGHFLHLDFQMRFSRALGH